MLFSITIPDEMFAMFRDKALTADRAVGGCGFTAVMMDDSRHRFMLLLLTDELTATGVHDVQMPTEVVRTLSVGFNDMMVSVFGPHVVAEMLVESLIRNGADLDDDDDDNYCAVCDGPHNENSPHSRVPKSSETLH